MADYFDAPCRGSPDQELLARFGLGKDGFGETPKPARGVRADWHSVRSAECCGRHSESFRERAAVAIAHARHLLASWMHRKRLTMRV
jgi:hypothetical protein